MRVLLLTVAASALAPCTVTLRSAGRRVAVSSAAYEVDEGGVSTAPFDVEAPAVDAEDEAFNEMMREKAAPPPKDVAALKSKLFAACAAADRGFAASPVDREGIEAFLYELEPLSPCDEPTRGIAEGAADAPLKKCWRLVYTSASDVSTLAANPISSLGGIYQDARELPVIVNVIDQFPRLLANLPPDAASRFATTTRLRVQTRARPRGASRVGLSFERVGAEQLSLFGREVPDWLPRPAVDLPQLGLDLQRRLFGMSEEEEGDPRDSEKNPAFFDVMFLDEELLVIKQGSPGGMFAAVAVDDLAKGH